MVVLAYLKRDLANELDKNNDGKIDSSEAAGQGQGYLDMLGSQFAARGAVPPGAAPAATGRAVDGPAVHAVHSCDVSEECVCCLPSFVEPVRAVAREYRQDIAENREIADRGT